MEVVSLRQQEERERFERQCRDELTVTMMIVMRISDCHSN
jgi:hypothetical protein